MKRRAFTIIELLVVIAIIALLGSLLVMGLSHLSRNAKSNATKADLENIHGMFDEMNASSHLSVRPVEWLWRQVAATQLYTDTGGGGDFWKIPQMTQDPRGAGFPAVKDCLDAPPGALTTDFPIVRNGSRAVLNTQLAMRIMLAYPANKAAFAQLPADRWMIPTWVMDSTAQPMLAGTGRDGILVTADDGTDTISGVVYAVNNCVQDLDQKATPPVMRTYRCVIANKSVAANEPYQDATGSWVVDANPTPVLLDAWNNPLIFVPASGLINVYGNVTVSPPVFVYNPSSGYTVTADSKDTIAALPNMPAPSPSGGRYIAPIQFNNRPFFVSAGPDGDLSTGDDNIYSFEK